MVVLTYMALDDAVHVRVSQSRSLGNSAALLEIPGEWPPTIRVIAHFCMQVTQPEEVHIAGDKVGPRNAQGLGKELAPVREISDLHRKLSGSLIEPFWSPARGSRGG